MLETSMMKVQRLVFRIQWLGRFYVFCFRSAQLTKQKWFCAVLPDLIRNNGFLEKRRYVDDFFRGIVTNVGGVDLLFAGIHQCGEFAVFIEVVHQSRPAGDDEVAVANGFDAVAASF